MKKLKFFLPVLLLIISTTKISAQSQGGSTADYQKLIDDFEILFSLSHPLEGKVHSLEATASGNANANVVNSKINDVAEILKAMSATIQISAARRHSTRCYFPPRRGTRAGTC